MDFCGWFHLVLKKLAGFVKKPLFKYVLNLFLLVCIVFAVRLYTQKDLVDALPPGLHASLLDGQTIPLNSFQGKPLLIYFWASWCPVCQLQKNAINAVSQDYPVLSIAMQSGNSQQIRDYIAENKLKFSVANDEHGLLSRQLGVNSVPVSFILQPDGKIAFREIGYTTEWGLRIRLWLADKR